MPPDEYEFYLLFSFFFLPFHLSIYEVAKLLSCSVSRSLKGRI